MDKKTKTFISKFVKQNLKIEFDTYKRANIYNLYLTLSNRNVKLTVTKLDDKEVIFKKSLGGYGVKGYTRRAYHLNYQFGLYFGSFLNQRFPGYYHLIVRGWAAREKGIIKALFKGGLKIITIRDITPIAFNGCRKIHKRRK